MAEKESDSQRDESGSTRPLTRLGAYWVRGAIYILVVVLAVYAIRPIFEFIEPLTNKAGFILVVTLIILIAPTATGWIAAKYISPRVSKWRSVGDMQSWEDRIVDELAPGRSRGFPVVLVNWPNENIRSPALLASRYKSSCGKKELAIVYFPGVPHPSRGGYTRVVSADQIEMTDWSMSDLFTNCVSFGATGPEFFPTPLENAE